MSDKDDSRVCGPDEVMLDINDVKSRFKEWDLVGDGRMNPEQAAAFLDKIIDHAHMRGWGRVKCLSCGREWWGERTAQHNGGCPKIQPKGRKVGRVPAALDQCALLAVMLTYGAHNPGERKLCDLAAERNVHPKRLERFVLKWIMRGWYECGTSYDMGWLTPYGVDVLPEFIRKNNHA